MEIVEKRNEQLERWAVKFHGMVRGSKVLIYGKAKGVVEGFNLTSNNPYIRAFNQEKGFASEYDPKNVELT